jgi:FkbM family methyltransferase
MKKPGQFLRKYFPYFYFPLVYLINRVKKITTPYTIYITDSLGGSFKQYLAGPDITEKISELKTNLDPESVNTVDVIVKRIAYYPDESNRHKMSRKQEVAGGLIEGETEQARKKIVGAVKEAGSKYRLNLKRLEESVFYYYHGLKLLPPEVADYIAGSEFIDIGAYVGDSAIALKEYNYSRIFSVEMSLKSIGKYKNNMARNNIGIDKYEIINTAIVSDDLREPVQLADTGSPGFSLLRDKGKYDEIRVDQKSLDYIVEKYKLSPRFIKVDIEGSALELVRGATKTLEHFRPVLSIAIYHNPYEFFEVKPFLEDFLYNYKFMIRKLSTGIMNNLCHSDVFLIGYPEEITG